MAYVALGRQALFSLNYEREKHLSPHVFFAAHLGIGGIPGAKDGVYEEFQSHRTVFTGAALLIGKGKFFLEAGLDPQFYWVGFTSFCNVDGNISVRFQEFKKGSLFLQAGFTPILFTTHQNLFNVPFVYAMGVNF